MKMRVRHVYELTRDEVATILFDSLDGSNDDTERTYHLRVCHSTVPARFTLVVNETY